MFCFLFFCVILAGLPLNEGKRVGEYDPKYGTFVGRLSTLHHAVTGDVYAADNTTIYIRAFNYDGEAPDAFFFAGNRATKPSNRGFVIPDERNRTDPLGPYRNRNLQLTFPVRPKGQRSFSDIKWISVWCRKYAIDFGHVEVPSGLELPGAETIGRFTSENDIVESSDVIVEDAETVLIKKFSYDGSFKDAIFVMGSGKKDDDGKQIPNERGSTAPLGRYSRKTISLKLPKSPKGTHIQYIGLFSPSKGMLASVTFPPKMRLPPVSN